jgi:uncharacterized protein with GYD domain
MKLNVIQETANDAPRSSAHPISPSYGLLTLNSRIKFSVHLYKYMKPGHAKGLINHGTIRIGTLYEFRDSEDARADKLEGTRQYEMRGSRVDTSLNTPEAYYLRQQGFDNCILDNSHPSGSLMITERVSHDCYIYCVSSEFNDENLKKFGGACIRIKDPNEYFSILGSSLEKKGYVAGAYEMCEIVYCPKDKVYTFNKDVPQDIPGWCIKPSIFSPEKERRIAWNSTKETDLKPALAVSQFVT